MNNTSVRLLNVDEVKQSISMPEVLRLVESAFLERGMGRVQMPPKSYLYFPDYRGDLRIMPAHLEATCQPGVKLVSVHPDNPKNHGLPTVQATIILFNPETGLPVCIMDGTLITAMRTAAASGVAAKYLARADSHVLGIVGAGSQSFSQIVAMSEVLELQNVVIYDAAPDRAEGLGRSVREVLSVSTTTASSAQEVAECSDVIVTVTPSTLPVIWDNWVMAGTHISAIGADAPGKQELDPTILQRAKIVIDDWAQASHSGEINVPIERGLLTRDSVYGEIGEIVAGTKPGRVARDEITVFDSTGLAIQDVVTAWHVFQTAEERGLGHLIAPLGLSQS